MPIIFITGTDTGVGKTTFTVQWARALQAKGHDVLALKPVASGSEWIDGQWRNDDALQLQVVASRPRSYDEINPVALKNPWSPHLAAEAQGELLTMDRLDQWFDGLTIDPKTYVLVEGAGGWYCPINRQDTLADWVVRRGWPVVMVVGLRLGCLNHSMLTAKAIVADGVQCLGWVANTMGQPMDACQQNRETLIEKLPMPLMADLDERLKIGCG